MGLRNIKVTQVLPYKVPEIEDVSASLPWHKTEKWDQRPVESIRRIIIHHTASEAPLYNQAAYHVNTHGWAGLSYHLIISGGRINKVNSLEDITFHAASNNMDSVAICIHGDLSKRGMTSQERELLYAAILTVKSLCTIDQVIGHNEVNATTCPATSMNQIRDDIKTLEMRMQRNSTLEAQMERAFSVANQSAFMYNQAKLNDGDGVWARHWLDEVYSIMKEKGLL